MAFFSRRNFIGSFIPSLLGIVFVVSTALVWSVLRFGSVNDAWLYANGRRVLVEPKRVVFEAGKPGEERTPSFTVRNLTTQPVTVVGAKTSCGCITATGLPVEIAPGGSRTLQVAVHLEGDSSGKLEQTVGFVTDYPGLPTFNVTFTGAVISP